MFLAAKHYSYYTQGLVELQTRAASSLSCDTVNSPWITAICNFHLVIYRLKDSFMNSLFPAWLIWSQLYKILFCWGCVSFRTSSWVRDNSQVLSQFYSNKFFYLVSCHYTCKVIRGPITNINQSYCASARQSNIFLYFVLFSVLYWVLS